MNLSLLLQGVIIGFSIAAPVGPIGVLCIRRTLSEGRLSGLLSGLGAATADLCYGCIAAFGLSWVGRAILDYQNLLRLVGGLFLAYLGLRTFFAPPTSADKTDASQRHKDTKEKGVPFSAPLRLGGGRFLSAYGSTFLLTLTNPMTILSFAGIFAGAGVASASYAAAAWMVAGVFFGSAAWWLLLSGGVGLFRERVTPGALLWTNRLSGAVIVLFGARFIWQAIAELIE
jgi:threonine/homoserine/homoserine lactone efflux protein